MNRLANICLRSLLFLIITIIPVDAFSEKFIIDNVSYRTIDDKCAEVHSAAEVDSINIHGEVNGYTVTHIRERVFFDHHKTYHISIPNTITHIGNAAFWHCKYLQELVIPPSVRHIGNYAFNGLHLIKSATIPKSVTSIGHAIFHPCFVLTELNVEEGNPVYDSRENCNGIIETATNTIIASCLTTKIPNSVKHIGKSCFSSAEFSSIEIPESIETIKARAFSTSKIEKINLPNSITEIGDSAFMLCSSLLGPLNIPKRVKHIGKNTFYGCIYISSVTFPDSLETIGDEAFKNCTFGDIKLPSTVKHIGNYAFNHFNKKKVIARITIPDSTKTIGTDIINENHIGVIYNAENCTVTKTVFRPKKSILFGRKVKSVPYNLLKHNYNIPIIISQNTIPPQIDDDFFNDSIKSFATLYVPKGYIETYRKATGWQKIQNIEENPGEFTSLTLNKSHLELPELQCDSVTAQTTPHTNPNLIAWSFSLDERDFTTNPDIEIDQTGKIYALHDPSLMLSQHGKITAHTLDGSDLEASCSFNKFDIIADSIYFDKSEITIKQGETDTLTMFILPKNCTHLSGYSYLIDPEISMTVNRNGSFYNHKIGNPFGLNNIIYSITSKIPGDYTLTIITDIDTVSFPIKVLKDSAVEIVPFDNKPASEISRYDIHGRKLPRPMPGINIIKMSDGTIRKEYVK